MKNYSPIGNLTKPTLVYSMGLVLISLPKLHAYVDDIHDLLRDEYPLFGKVEVETSLSPIDGHGPSSTETSTQYLLNGPDNTWGVVLAPDRITLHTSAYKNFKDFGAKFNWVLDQFLLITKLKYCSGVAFRHVDNIRPIEGESGLADCVLSRYLADDIRGEDPERVQIKHEYRYKIGDRNILSRLGIFETHKGPTVPSDISPYYFSLNLSNPPIDRGVNPPYVLADFEANNLFNNKTQSFEAKQITEELDTLHRYASNAYQQIMKPEALKRRK